MTRIVDLRLVQTRDGRVRVIVEGRRLFEAASASAALGFVTSQLAKVEPHRQLGALASALVGATEPVQTGCTQKAHVSSVGHPEKSTKSTEPVETGCVAEAAGANETGSVEKAHVSSGLEGEEPTKTAGANETGSVAGKAVG